jgi:outer membrane immunogenic protein
MGATRFLLPFAFVTALSMPAFAADMSAPPPSPVIPTTIPSMVFNWTGGYVGAQVGYRFGDIRPGRSADSAIGGLYAGYNQQFGNLVAGVEADVAYGNGRGGALGFTMRQDWEGSVRARAGVAFERFMPYITGGVAFTHLEASNAGGKDTKTRTGWTAGAGLEYALTDNVSLRGEYRYSGYGKTSFNLPGAGRTALDDQSVRLGVGYKF